MKKVGIGSAIAGVATCALMGCGDSDAGGEQNAVDAGHVVLLDDAAVMPAIDGAIDDASDAALIQADTDATGDAGSAPRFITRVVSFTPGDCAGFGQSALPGIVMGPPLGNGTANGSVDVVSLGNGGVIVVSFEPNAIVDGPGADFIVFENAFYVSGDPSKPYAELGEVSVSDDGNTWMTFPCSATAYPYGACAGWHAVFSNPMNGISPFDPNTAGGDAFDLADLGVAHARYVRIRDITTEACPPPPNNPTSNGFDLDAIAIVNPELP